MKNVLITGANRGLGFEFTKQYLELNNKVFATCRNLLKSSDLSLLKDKFKSHLQIIEMDVANEELVKNMIEIIENSNITSTGKFIENDKSIINY